MPFNGSGTYAAPSSPGAFNPAVTGSNATPAAWNTLLDDLETALSTCITKDGQTTVTANIPMATFKFTGLGNGSAATDSAALGQVAGAVKRMQVFTASGTYTPHANMVNCIIECRGGGGGGGGAATAGVGAIRCGGGGGQGEYARKIATAADIGASQVVTIAAAAAGGTGNADGANGGAVSVGVLCVANGGTGGESGNSSANAGGAGGTGGTGDYLVPGAPGGAGMFTSIVTVSAVSGAGGGAGGGRPAMRATNDAINGDAAVSSSGGGGGGALTFNTAAGTDVTGGAGGGGTVVVTEFCWA